MFHMSSPLRVIIGGTLWASAVALVFAADFSPARLVSGSAPPMPVNVVGWTDVRLELEVGENGQSYRTVGLRATPGALPFIEPVIGSWTFRPAEYLSRRATSAVLVVTMFRPPQLFDNAPGGSPPVDLAPPSEAVPYPTLETLPKYPPNAIVDAVVVVEVLVGVDGKVEEATVIGSAAGFDSAALDAARGWGFRPARYRGEPVPAYAYLVFGFRAPVTGGSPFPGFE